MTKFDYSYLADAIENGKPRVHATGFAQLYLRPDVRLHVWTDALFRHAPDQSQIAFYHDHRYGIVSHVLRGAIMDSPAIPCDTNGSNGGPGDWSIWEVRPAGEGQPDKPHRGKKVEDNELEVRLPPPRLIKAGDGYHIPKRTFHATRALGTTVTLMRKLNEEPAWARLLVPKGFDPVHSLVTQPPIDFVRYEMLEALGALSNAKIAAAAMDLGL